LFEINNLNCLSGTPFYAFARFRSVVSGQPCYEFQHGLCSGAVSSGMIASGSINQFFIADGLFLVRSGLQSGINFQINSTTPIYTRPGLNLIASGNITLLISDNPANKRVDISIASTSGAVTQSVGNFGDVQLADGTGVFITATNVSGV